MSRNSTKTRELDNQSYTEKVLHWGTEDDPWRPDGEQCYFPNPTWTERRITMIEGDIRRMPELIGRPCFGILTAFLRFRDAKRFVKNRGYLPSSRCATCRISTQCGDVVQRRIEAVPELKAAYEAWLIVDGPREIVHPGWQSGRSGSAWKRLVRAACAHPFSSVNDQKVVDHYIDLDRKRREDDRKSKATRREKARRAGEIDSGHESDLADAMKNRVGRVVDAVIRARATDTPRWQSRLSQLSIVRMFDVWLGREVLRARKQKPTAAAISRWIVENGKRNISKNQFALAARVKEDLDRIERFESTVWQGESLLPPFDPRTEFNRE